MRFSKSRLKNYPKYTIISIKKCFKRAVSRKTSVFIWIYLMIWKDNKKFKFYIRSFLNNACRSKAATPGSVGRQENRRLLS